MVIEYLHEFGFDPQGVVTGCFPLDFTTSPLLEHLMEERTESHGIQRVMVLDGLDTNSFIALEEKVESGIRLEISLEGRDR